MLEKLVFYLIGALTLFVVVSNVVSMAVVFLAILIPYMALAASFIMPTIGAWNIKKAQVSQNGQNVSSVFKKMSFVTKFLSKKAYLALGVCCVFALPSLLDALIEQTAFMLSGVVIAPLMWEGVRLFQRQTKKQELPSFVSAVKASW